MAFLAFRLENRCHILRKRNGIGCDGDTGKCQEKADKEDDRSDQPAATKIYVHVFSLR